MGPTDHPRVYFRLVGEDFGDSCGYLFIIDGVPWLAATREDAASRVSALMHQLDPQLLQERRDSETGEQFFCYQPYLQISPV